MFHGFLLGQRAEPTRTRLSQSGTAVRAGGATSDYQQRACPPRAGPPRDAGNLALGLTGATVDGAMTLFSLPVFGEGQGGVFLTEGCVAEKAAPRPSPKTGRENGPAC